MVAPNRINPAIMPSTNVFTQNALFLGQGYVIVESLKSSMKTIFALDNNFTDPVMIINTLKRQKHFKNMKFSKDAQTIMTLPNAGGNSINSEALSCDILGTMFNAKLQARQVRVELLGTLTDFAGPWKQTQTH